MSSGYFAELRKRFEKLSEGLNVSSRLERELPNRESPSDGALEYLLDSLCLPFHVLLRGRMGRNYFTFTKILLSSLFFLLCLSLVQFRFTTDLYISPFTPGGLRLVPDIDMPPSVGHFLSNLASSWTLWMASFKPTWSQVVAYSSSPAIVAAKLTSIYYLIANARLLGGKFMARLGDVVNLESSGECKLFGVIPIWRHAYALSYLFNFKTDIVKQYVEPLLLFTLAQIALDKDNSDLLVFPGICCLIGSLLLAIQAYVRSLPLRREADDMLRAKFRTEARESQMDFFDLFAEAPTKGGETGNITMQNKR